MPGVDGFGGSGTIAWFVILAYGFSWAWWIPLAISPTIVDPGQGWPTHLLGLTGPALAAIVVIGFSEGQAGLRDVWSRIVRWRVGWVWYGVIAATAGLAVTPLITESDLNAADFVLYSGAPSAGFAVVLYVFVVNGLGEEIGWRGFLADRLLLRTSQGRTALIVWPIWGLWHLPLFWIVANFREFGGRHVGEIDHPQLVGLRGGEVPTHQIRRADRGRIGSGRGEALVPAHPAQPLGCINRSTWQRGTGPRRRRHERRWRQRGRN